MSEHFLDIRLMARYFGRLGIIKNWQIKIFKYLVNWIYGNCDLILAQSKSILKEVNNYASVKNNPIYFPSWGESNLFFNTHIQHQK